MGIRQRILLVEDDPKVAAMVRLYLESGGYEVVACGDGRSALERAGAETFDLVLLDLMLPEVDGLTVCRRLREGSAIPIIMLTARATEGDRIRGLDLGADDYVPKPFSPRELLARVRAVLRRSSSDTDREVLEFGDLRIDVGRRSVAIAGREIDLTGAQLDLLIALARAPGVAMTREDLIERAFGLDYPGLPRTVDAHIKDLRRKLEPDPRRPRYIETVYGFGYRLADSEGTSA